MLSSLTYTVEARLIVTSLCLMGGFFNIAAVFKLVKLESFTFAALKNKCVGAVIIVFVLCWMNATFSYIAFYIHFDTHLTECQFHRHHGDDCRASCILKEMASEQGLSEQIIALAYAFPVFLFQKKPSFPHARLTGTLVANHASHYLKHYSPPTLGIQLPPPQYSKQWSVVSGQWSVNSDQPRRDAPKESLGPLA